MPQLQHETCTVEGCVRPHKARGLCAAHYQHHLRGVPLKPEITPRAKPPSPICSEEGCSDPVKAKGLCKAHYQRLLRHGHTRPTTRQREPKPCSVEGCASHRYAKGMCHQHYQRKNVLAAKYGVTPAWVAQTLDAQGGVCGICQRGQRAVNGSTGKLFDMNVDHCHTTGKVRGLLCHNCNRALGMFDDSPDILRRALAYLEKHST